MTGLGICEGIEAATAAAGRDEASKRLDFISPQTSDTKNAVVLLG
jgi:hypothetical protein